MKRMFLKSKCQNNTTNTGTTAELRKRGPETRKAVWYKTRQTLQNYGDVAFAQGDRKTGEKEKVAGGEEWTRCQP